MRIGTMIKQLLEEVRAAPLDEASRNRLRDIHASSIRELEQGLAPELREELAIGRVDPFALADRQGLELPEAWQGRSAEEVPAASAAETSGVICASSPGPNPAMVSVPLMACAAPARAPARSQNTDNRPRRCQQAARPAGPAW